MSCSVVLRLAKRQEMYHIYALHLPKIEVSLEAAASCLGSSLTKNSVLQQPLPLQSRIPSSSSISSAISPMKRRSSSPSASHGILVKTRLRPVRCSYGGISDNSGSLKITGSTTSPFVSHAPLQYVAATSPTMRFVQPSSLSESPGCADIMPEIIRAGSGLPTVSEGPVMEIDNIRLIKDTRLPMDSIPVASPPNPLSEQSTQIDLRSQHHYCASSGHSGQSSKLDFEEPMEVALGADMMSESDEGKSEELLRIHRVDEGQAGLLSKGTMFETRSDRNRALHQTAELNNLEKPEPPNTSLLVGGPAVGNTTSSDLGDANSEGIETMNYLHRLWITLADQETDPLPHYVSPNPRTPVEFWPYFL
ncbi:unnamed protein product [Protopolystoma xenopodis]|uniref:Uncharacterized protein n=1 Tax=Protopolystoma xenopodis TaxID=117903 RepID=A0A448WI87_9PLAT|nr:unnamed protein product [Protopolystoma xenopodis]